MASSEARLRELRRWLNDSLRVKWEAQQRLHEANINAVLADFGQPAVHRTSSHRGPADRAQRTNSTAEHRLATQREGEEDTELDAEDDDDDDRTAVEGEEGGAEEEEGRRGAPHIAQLMPVSAPAPRQDGSG